MNTGRIFGKFLFLAVGVTFDTVSSHRSVLPNSRNREQLGARAPAFCGSRPSSWGRVPLSPENELKTVDRFNIEPYGVRGNHREWRPVPGSNE